MDVVEVEQLIVGAGVIGLACAAGGARAGRSVFVLEAGPGIGHGISSRNSEVIHSGIYYPTGSLKHVLCVEGRRLLYAYCDRAGVPYRRCGKLVVATDAAEAAKIEGIAARARANEVEGVALITGAAARALEPELIATAALHSVETGILDSHAFMAALQGEVEDAGGAVLARHRVVAGEAAPGRFRVIARGPEGDVDIRSARLVLAAGPWTHAVAGRIAGYDIAPLPRLRLAKGSYFAYGGRPVFSRLIYPAPVDGGLGTHLTLDLAGRMRFGPDVEWLATDDPDAVDFAVDPARGAAFAASVARWWPGIDAGRLQADYAGVRPKLSGPGEPVADFAVDGVERHGLSGLVGLFGVESPGLTSALALAERVEALQS
jgi:L-2-hydroxyglutarate oxidase LhgO